MVATPSKGNWEGRAKASSIASLLGVGLRSSDISLRIACCWTIERLTSRDGNEEKVGTT